MGVSKAAQQPKLPPPPEIKRKIVFNPTQAIGMPLLLLIPVCGLLGLLDTNETYAEAIRDGLKVSVKYPSRLRHKTAEPLQITVENQTGGVVPKLQVKLSRTYLDGFEDVAFIPEPNKIDGRFVVFDFTAVSSGEKRRVEMEMRSSRTGSFEAEVQAHPEGGGQATVRFSTFVMP